MSKGSQIVPVRIEPALLAEIDAAVRRSMDSFDPHTRSSWILSAIREKLAHQRRGKRRKKDSPPVQENAECIATSTSSAPSASPGNP